MLRCLIVVVVVMVKVIDDELSTTQGQISSCSGLSDISGNLAARFSATLIKRTVTYIIGRFHIC